VKGGSRVNVVDADELVLDEHLAVLGLRNGSVRLVLQDVCSARLLNDDGFHGLWDGRHGSCECGSDTKLCAQGR
jgi:hypothetical protein